MTATWTDIPTIPRVKTQDVTLPKPQPFAAPVFIGDCSSPLAGETVLSLLWKRIDKTNQ